MAVPSVSVYSPVPPISSSICLPPYWCPHVAPGAYYAISSYMMTLYPFDVFEEIWWAILMLRVWCTGSDSSNDALTHPFQIISLEYEHRHLPNPIPWGPPCARSGWVASHVNSPESAFESKVEHRGLVSWN